MCYNIKKYSFILVVCSTAFVFLCCQKHCNSSVETIGNDSDIEIIKDRVGEDVWKQGYRYCEMSLKEQPVKDNKGGAYLRSIDYKSSKPAEWPAIGHLEYIMAYLRKIGEENLKTNKEAQLLVTEMLDYWLRNDFKNKRNWYWNKIGVPYDLADICVMFGDYLDARRLIKIEKILNRGTYGKGIPIKGIIPESNSTDWMDISIKHAVVFNNKILLKKYIELLNNLVDYGFEKRTGIQKDYSYFCYSVLASGGSYSAVYSRNIAYFMSILYDTEYQIDKEKEKLFVDFLLEGQRFFNRGFGAPHFCIARSAVFADGGEDFYNALSRLVKLDSIYRREDLQEYLESFRDFSFIKPTIKCFDIPGVLVSESKDGYYAVRGCMDGYGMTDVQNQEGVLNFNLSYGSNISCMYYGDEYSSIGAVYDFSMFPGTTTYYMNDNELLLKWENEYNKTWGHYKFYKSPLSNCQLQSNKRLNAGVLITELHNDGINGKNIFIIKDNTLYAMGTGFNSDGKNGKTIITIVDQCLAEDDNYFHTKLAKGQSYSNRAFTYTNLSDAELVCCKKNQKGSFSRTNLNGEYKQESHNVFSCYYNWDDKMENVSYAYKVSPANSSEKDVIKIYNKIKGQIIEFDSGIIVGYAYKGFDYTECNGLLIHIEPGFVFVGNEQR